MTQPDEQMDGRQDRDEARRGGISRRFVVSYLITGATLAVSRIVVLVCSSHWFRSDAVNATFQHLLWVLFPEALIVTQTSLGVMPITWTAYLWAGGALLTAGSFVMTTPILLVGWLMQPAVSKEARDARLKGDRVRPVFAVALAGFFLAVAGIAWQAHGARRPAPRAGDAATGGGPAGGDVFSIAIDPGTPSTVYALAGDRVFKSVDGGGSWRSVKRLPDHGLPAITVDPSNPSRLFVPARGAFVRTTNGGDSWQPVEADSQRPAASGRLLYAVGSNAVYQSRDGGETWKNLASLGDLPHDTLSAFASDSGRPSLLYLGMFRNGMLKSVDGGERWTPAGRGLPTDEVTAIAIDPSSPAVVYAGLKDAGVFRTRDAGGDWAAVNVGLGNTHVNSLAIDPSRPSVVYAGTDEGVFKSVDAGESWRATRRGLSATRVYTLAIDPSHTDVLYAGCLHGVGVAKSIDGGETWFPARSGLSALWIKLLVQGSGAASVYAATEEEVFAYRGGRWSSIASSRENFGGDAVSALAADLTNPGTLYVGTSDEVLPSVERPTALHRRGHIYRSTDGGSTWSAADAALPSRPVSSVAVDPANGAVLWASTPEGLFRSHDSGASWTEVRWYGDSLAFYRPVVDPIHPATVFALKPLLHLLKSTDRGKTWSFAAKGLPTEYRGGESISSVVIDPNTPDVMYASQEYGAEDRHPLYRSKDGGLSWVRVGPRLPIPGLLSLAIDPRNPRSLLGAAGERLLRSVDGGGTWSEVSTGFPGGGFIRAIVFDAARPGTVYAGTEDGVFVSADGGITWRPTDPR